MKEKAQEILSVFAGLLLIPYFFAGPLTFAWLVYTNAQTGHSFFQWIILLVINAFLASIWPIYWLIQLFKYIFGF